MFYLAGVGLAFFLTVLLLTKSRKTFADKILAWWLFIITAHLLLFYFGKMGLYPQLLGIELPLPLVHGPFLYLYTLALTNKQVSARTVVLHFIPVIAIFTYLIHFFALPLEEKIDVYKNQGAGYETFNLIRLILIIASGILYVTLSNRLLRKHRIAIADQFSYIEKINLDWLQYLTYGIGVIWILVIFGNDDLVFAAVVLFILFIGFFGVRQVGIFQSSEVKTPAENNARLNLSQAPKIENDTIEQTSERRKYRKSGLSQDSSETLHLQLTRLMNDEKAYRESELSLTELARRLNTQPNYLSQVINEREGKNFYDYINTLRIDEFRRLAGSPECRKYTLVALAGQCGFNSKSSFNRYFKKVTGQSPSSFMQAVPVSEK